MGTKRYKSPLRARPREEYLDTRCGPEMQPGVADFLKLGKQALGHKHSLAHSLVDVDYCIQELLGPVAERDDDAEVRFSQKLYFALCATFASIKAEASATAELLVLRLREAEARIAQLEAAPRLEYAGVFAPTDAMAGFDKTKWTLAAKRGSDAKFLEGTSSHGSFPGNEMRRRSTTFLQCLAC